MTDRRQHRDAGLRVLAQNEFIMEKSHATTRKRSRPGTRADGRPFGSAVSSAEGIWYAVGTIGTRQVRSSSSGSFARISLSWGAEVVVA